MNITLEAGICEARIQYLQPFYASYLLWWFDKHLMQLGAGNVTFNISVFCNKPCETSSHRGEIASSGVYPKLLILLGHAGVGWCIALSRLSGSHLQLQGFHMVLLVFYATTLTRKFWRLLGPPSCRLLHSQPWIAAEQKAKSHLQRSYIWMWKFWCFAFER